MPRLAWLLLPLFGGWFLPFPVTLATPGSILSEATLSGSTRPVAVALVPGALEKSAPAVEVLFDGLRLEFRLDAVVRAPAEDVRAVIHEYDRLDRVFPLVVESRPLGPSGEGVERVFTRMRGCILFVCREIGHTLDIRRTQTGWSSGITVPERGRIRRGHFAWHIEERTAMTGHAELRMYGYLEPDFAIPRVLGGPLLRGWLRAELQDSVGRIEGAARAHQASREAVSRGP